MSDFFSMIDVALFNVINTAAANPVFDFIMPPLTDWNKSWIGLSLFGSGYLCFLWKGGRKARIVGLLLVVLILFTDQLSSHLLKPLISRPRPCHVVDSKPVIDHVRLLVECGSGYSFPSSHAVNNFGFAVFLGYYYRRWQWLLLFYAFLMALSRVVVGVHFPSDVAAGAVIGTACAYTLIWLWNLVGARYTFLQIQPQERHEMVKAA